MHTSDVGGEVHLFPTREWALAGEGRPSPGLGPAHRGQDRSGPAGTFLRSSRVFRNLAPHPEAWRSPREREQGLRSVWVSFPRPGAGVPAGRRTREGRDSGPGSEGEEAPGRASRGWGTGGPVGAHLARVRVLHRVHVEDLLHGAGEYHVRLLLAPLQRAFRARPTRVGQGVRGHHQEQQ